VGSTRPAQDAMTTYLYHTSCCMSTPCLCTTDVVWTIIGAARKERRRSLGRDSTPIHEFVYKLDRIPERLYTAAARAIAAERQAFMRAFFDRLDEEMLGDWVLGIGYWRLPLMPNT